MEVKAICASEKSVGLASYEFSKKNRWLIRETQVNSALTSQRALGICCRCCQALASLVQVQDTGGVVVCCVCWLRRAELPQKKQVWPADKQCWGFCYFHEGPWNPDKCKAAYTSALGQLGAPAWARWKIWSSTCYSTEHYLPTCKEELKMGSCFLAHSRMRNLSYLGDRRVSSQTSFTLVR